MAWNASDEEGLFVDAFEEVWCHGEGAAEGGYLGLLFGKGFGASSLRKTVSPCVSLKRLVPCVKYIPMILPAIDEPIPSELAHRRCAELCKDCKHYDFVQLDAQIHEISHRAFDPNLVRFLRCIVWQAMV